MSGQRQRLLTTCSRTGRMAPTQLVERADRLHLLSGRVVFWCALCRGTHGLNMHRGELQPEAPRFGGGQEIAWALESA